MKDEQRNELVGAREELLATLRDGILPFWARTRARRSLRRLPHGLRPRGRTPTRSPRQVPQHPGEAGVVLQRALRGGARPAPFLDLAARGMEFLRSGCSTRSTGAGTGRSPGTAAWSIPPSSSTARASPSTPWPRSLGAPARPTRPAWRSRPSTASTPPRPTPSTAATSRTWAPTGRQPDRVRRPETASRSIHTCTCSSRSPSWSASPDRPFISAGSAPCEP